MNQKKPTTGIILAAGRSLRLGRPKQLIEFRGKYLLELVLDAAINSDLERVILVLGYHFQNILEAFKENLRRSDVHVIINPKYDEGQSRSIRAGLSEIRDAFPSVMFLLGDQPFTDSEMINDLLTCFWESEKDICVPVCQGKRGTPVIFGRPFYDRLMEIKGDIGARNIIRAHPESVVYAEVNNPLYFFDIDTEEDIRYLRGLNYESYESSLFLSDSRLRRDIEKR